MFDTKKINKSNRKFLFYGFFVSDISSESGRILGISSVSSCTYFFMKGVKLAANFIMNQNNTVIYFP